MMSRYSREALARLSPGERGTRCAELAEQIAKGLMPGDGYHQSVYAAVEVLRGLGHELWSYDEGDEYQVWGSDYQKNGAIGIIMTCAGMKVLIEWSPQTA